MINDEKKKLRSLMLKKRGYLSEEENKQCSRKIRSTLINLDTFKNANVIMLYLSFKNEVDTYNIVKWCFEQGKRVIVPYCIKETSTIVPCEITNLDVDLVKGSYGILEPKVDCLKKVNIDDIDVVIVPGVVFDINCNRVGFGAGYYDRFLSKAKNPLQTIALSYDFQVVDKVPADEFDKPLDMIITEKRIILK